MENKKIKEKNWLRRVVEVYALFFLLFIGFVAGLAVSNLDSAGNRSNVIEITAGEIQDIFSNIEGVDPEVFNQAWEVVHKYYFKRNQVAEKELFYKG